MTTTTIPAAATATASRLILVHGGWCWYRVATLLLRRGPPRRGAQVYVVCGQDQAIVEAYQRRMIANCPVAEVREIAAADHMAMFSAPAELSGHLADVANTYA